MTARTRARPNCPVYRPRRQPVQTRPGRPIDSSSKMEVQWVTSRIAQHRMCRWWTVVRDDRGGHDEQRTSAGTRAAARQKRFGDDVLGIRIGTPREPRGSTRTGWLATTRPDGRPHLMPVIAFWVDGALHIVAGEGSRKARNLAADGRCVIGTSKHEAAIPRPRRRGTRGVAPPITMPSGASPSSSTRTTGHSRPRGTRSTGRTRQPRGRRRTRSSGSSRRRRSASPGMSGMDQFDPGDPAEANALGVRRSVINRRPAPP